MLDVFVLACLFLWRVGCAAAPGAKVSINEYTLSYVSMIPFFEKQFQAMKFPEISQKINTPIGGVTFTISDLHLETLSMTTPSYIFGSPTALTLHVDHAKSSAHSNWKYREDSWPHLSDSGSMDLTLDAGLTLTLNVIPSTAHVAGIDIKVSNVALGFTQFDIHLHGGASWLYNLVIGQLKGTIENAIENAVKTQVPALMENTVMKELDSYVIFPIIPSQGVDFSFVFTEFKLDKTHGSMTMGTVGECIKKGLAPFPGTPVALPDVLDYSSMASIFVSDFSVDSVGYVLAKTNLLHYIVNNSIIPPKFPFKLNTESFKYFIPALYAKYPNMDMQIEVEVDPSNPPAIHFSTANGADVFLQADAIFSVLDAGKVVEVFTIDVIMKLNATVIIKDTSGHYFITGTLKLGEFEMSVEHSEVGPIDVSKIADVVRVLLADLVIPMLNDYLAQSGIPFPNVPLVKLIAPEIVYHDAFLEVRTNFTITPPRKTD